MTTTYVTDHARQKELLDKALTLTGSLGFMADAWAMGVYRNDELAGVAVYECFRDGRAELHFGMTPGRVLTPEIISTIVTIAFHPKVFGLNRLLARAPVWNAYAQAALLKAQFQFEYRDRASVAGGEDGIVLSLERDRILEGMTPAGSRDETQAEAASL